MEDVNVKSFKHVKKGSQRRHQELGWLKDIGRQKLIGTKSKPEAMAAPPMQELVAWIALGLGLIFQKDMFFPKFTMVTT